MQPKTTQLRAFANPVVSEDMEYMRTRLEKAGQFDGTTVVVTGAAGFLGYYICHLLQHLDDSGIRFKSLVLLDKFVLGRPQWIDELVAANSRIEVHPFDIAHDKIDRIPAARGASYVFHMASIASPTFYRKYPLETLDANIWGLRNLLDFYRESSLKGLLFFSSSEIYGDPAPGSIPTNEEYRGNVSCLGPRACYDEAKRFGETLCHVFATTHATPVRLVRPFNNYGPGMALQDRRAPADFAKCILDRQDIIIHSSGAPTRTFCYVADAVLGYFKALLHDQFDVFNIGIDRPEITILQLAELFRKAGQQLTGYDRSVIFKPSADKDYLTHNPERRCPDISKARRILNFEPTILVEHGVERFLKFLWADKQTNALQ